MSWYIMILYLRLANGFNGFSSKCTVMSAYLGLTKTTMQQKEVENEIMFHWKYTCVWYGFQPVWYAFAQSTRYHPCKQALGDSSLNARCGTLVCWALDVTSGGLVWKMDAWCLDPPFLLVNFTCHWTWGTIGNGHGAWGSSWGRECPPKQEPLSLTKLYLANHQRFGGCPYIMSQAQYFEDDNPYAYERLWKAIEEPTVTEPVLHGVNFFGFPVLRHTGHTDHFKAFEIVAATTHQRHHFQDILHQDQLQAHEPRMPHGDRSYWKIIYQ